MKINLKPRIITELAISCSLTLLFAYLYFNINELVIETMPLALDPKNFPKAILISVLIFCFILVYFSAKLYFDYVKNIQNYQLILLEQEKEEASKDKNHMDLKQALRIVSYLLILFLYIATLYYFGFLYSTPVIMCIIVALLGYYKIWIAFPVCVIFSLVMDYACFNFLQIILPSGILFG